MRNLYTLFLIVFAYVLLGLANEAKAQNHISGNVYFDQDQSCSQHANEPGMDTWPVSITNGQDTYYTLTDIEGYYWFNIPNGTYDLQVHPLSESLFMTAGCAQVSSIVLNGIVDTVNVPVIALAECDEMLVDMVLKETNPEMPFNLFTTIRNVGSVASERPGVSIRLDDGLVHQGTDLEWNEDTMPGFIFVELDTIDLQKPFTFASRGFTNGHLEVETVVSNQVHGANVIDCESLPAWDQSTVVVDGYCNENDSVIFKIENTGVGHMSGSNNYIILQDDLLVYDSDQFSLQSGEVLTIGIEGDSSFYRLVAEQSENHPLLGNQTIVVEACNPSENMETPGNVGQSYDPRAAPSRDHRVGPIQQVATLEVYPYGRCDDRLIALDQRMEFTLRAKNIPSYAQVGFEMIMEIPVGLDPSTFRPGASTQPYVVMMEQGYLRWRFDDPLELPELEFQVDQAAVKFSMLPKSNVQPGNVLESEFMVVLEEPSGSVGYTSESQRQVFVEPDSIGMDCPLIISVDETNPSMSLKLFPNPAGNFVQVEYPKPIQRINLIGIEGKLISSASLGRIDVSSVPDGIYLVEVVVEGDRLWQKLVVQH